MLMDDIMRRRTEQAIASAAMHLPVVYDYQRHAGQPECYITPDGCLFDDWQRAVDHSAAWLRELATYDAYGALVRILAQGAKEDEE